VKVVVDRAKCTGIGICESLAPAHFEVNEEGELVLLKEGVAAEEVQLIGEAVGGCPTDALRLAD
jgi:ferredoxin